MNKGVTTIGALIGTVSGILGLVASIAVPILWIGDIKQAVAVNDNADMFQQKQLDAQQITLNKLVEDSGYTRAAVEALTEKLNVKVDMKSVKLQTMISSTTQL